MEHALLARLAPDICHHISIVGTRFFFRDRPVYQHYFEAKTFVPSVALQRLYDQIPSSVSLLNADRSGLYAHGPWGVFLYGANTSTVLRTHNTAPNMTQALTALEGGLVWPSSACSTHRSLHIESLLQDHSKEWEDLQTLMSWRSHDTTLEWVRQEPFMLLIEQPGYILHGYHLSQNPS